MATNKKTAKSGNGTTIVLKPNGTLWRLVGKKLVRLKKPYVMRDGEWLLNLMP